MKDLIVDSTDKSSDWVKFVNSDKKSVEKIEFDLTPLQKAKTIKRVWVKPTATKKGFYREQEVGRKEEERKSPRKDTGKIASLPESMRNEILELRRLGDSGASIKSQIENMIDASDDPKLKDNLTAKGILQSSSGAASLNVTGQSLTDWAKARGVESRKKRKTVKVAEAEAKEVGEKQFKLANEKLARLQGENKRLQDQLESERKSKIESDGIREKLRNENYILREKLKSAKIEKSVGSEMQIEIDLSKVERGLREEKVKVVRGGKTFYRKQRVGSKEKEKGTDFASQLKIGDKIKFMGEEKEITHIHDISGSFELDNKLSYSPKEINKYGESIKDEPKKPPVIMGLNKPEPEVEKPKSEKEKPEMVKPEVGKPKVEEEVPKVEEKTVADLTVEIDSFVSKLKSEKNGQEMLDEVEKYTMMTYFGINSYLRRGESKKERIDKQINNISTLLQSAPKMEGTVYRGMKFDSNEDFDKFLSQIENNKSFKSKSFTSTSIHEKSAIGHATSKYNNILFEIKSKNGVFLNGMSKIPGEGEILLDKNAKFNIINIDKSDIKNVRIIMEEV
jgi:hypothetical protein